MAQSSTRGSSVAWLLFSISALCSIGCGDDDSSEETGEPDAEVQNLCEPMPLADYCETRPCPATLAAATEDECSDKHPSVDIGVNDNSCGGQSLRIQSGLSASELHYDANDRLVGVRNESDIVHRCTEDGNDPGSVAYTFGRECTLTGTRRDACTVACPDIDCLSGAELEVEWPFTLAEARDIPITVCRNDECFTGMLGSQGDGFSVPTEMHRDQTGTATITFEAAGDDSVSLHMAWIPLSQADLQDGDRYKVTADAPGGARVLIDRAIDYGTSSVGTGSCKVTCTYANIDLRGQDTDGGVEDDAGL